MRRGILAGCILTIAVQALATTQDYYPAESRNLKEEGVTTIQVCVDEQGKLATEPVVVVSSGHPRLDEASITLAKSASGRYKPATRDGKPVPGCVKFNVKWKLQ